MSVLVGKETSLLIQGITGTQGRYHTQRSLDYGVNICAGVTPGKGGEKVLGVPVFNSVAEALQTNPEINTTLVMAPPKAVLASALEALEAGLKLVVIIAEFVPVHDSIKIVNRAQELQAKVVGPNTIGVISPGKSKVGIMPDYIYSPGKVGIISRSGTLTHETSSNLTFAGYGQSTCIGIGGDPVIGMTHTQALQEFRDDPDTEVVVIIGEIGGAGEELAARYIKKTNYPKPVIAYIAGAQAPEGKKMGHAGAIVSHGMGTAKSKIESLRGAGVHVAETLGRVLQFVTEEDQRLGGALSTVTPIRDNC